MWEHFVTVKDLLAINKVYKSLLADDEDRVCFRVEEPRVSFYFETETDIQMFLKEIPNSIRIYSIHGPKSESELQALKDNKIIYKNPMSDYAYCVTFKPGYYTELDIKTIFNLVNNLEAKTTPTFTRILKNNINRRIFGSYKVFIKTQADFTWMQLSVRSELIGKINQLHFVNK
jgi:hypothetical protein